MKHLITTAVILFNFTARADITEIVVSKFKPGLTYEKEMAMTKSVNDFIKSQPGFLGREVYYDAKQKNYVDVIKWKDEKSATDAAKKAEESPTCQPYFAQIEQQGLIFLHAKKVLEFKK